MSDYKKLLEKIKTEQSGSANDDLISVADELLKEEKKESSTIIKKSDIDEKARIKKKGNSLIDNIKESSKNSKTKDAMIHIRIEEKLLRKLIILNAVKLTNQSIVSYLIEDFLENEEIKNLIKKIVSNELE